LVGKWTGATPLISSRTLKEHDIDGRVNQMSDGELRQQGKKKSKKLRNDRGNKGSCSLGPKSDDGAYTERNKKGGTGPTSVKRKAGQSGLVEGKIRHSRGQGPEVRDSSFK